MIQARDLRSSRIEPSGEALWARPGAIGARLRGPARILPSPARWRSTRTCCLWSAMARPWRGRMRSRVPSRAPDGETKTMNEDEYKRERELQKQRDRAEI